MARTTREKQKLARIVRQKHGYEMTPDECDNTLASALAAFRKGMKAKGWTLPDDDDQLRDLIRRSKK
jgi:hypothetical protein